MNRYRKLIAAVVGAAVEAVALGVLDAKLLAVAVAFLTAAGVYAAPNETVPARRAPAKRKRP